jgi:prepilin-type N-terminal cleavage/methylation domain-containing protein
MKKGFTLAELIVSISIITLLSVIGVQTYVTAQRSAQLKSDVITVTSAIRQAQNRALSPSRSDLTGIGIDDELCAMGVEVIAPKTIKSYYVVKPCSTTTPTYYGTDIVLQSATLKSGGKFEFRLPFANNRSTAQSIQLELPGSGVVEKTITVTKDSGLIKVE